MRLEQLYRSGKPEISFEFFPPKTAEGTEKLFGDTIPRLKKFQPALVSMTYGAGGTTRELTLELCDRLKRQADLETMCHLNIVGQSRTQIRENLQRLKELGIYNLLALRGDPPRDDPNFKPHPEGLTSSVELIEEARRLNWFSIAVTGFPEVHPEAKDRAADIAYLKRKVGAGGCVIVTQLFLDNAFFFEFMEEVKRAGITAPVIPGILPILSAPQIRRFAALCGSTIPPAVEKNLAKYEEDDAATAQYGVELATRQCEELLKKARVPGLHFYCLNRPEAAEAILKNLGLSPAPQK
ncbi:MAG: methylenetetrahydrofolate reductase [NAD(P)H] [Candidatus Omnitrophica bacterium CG11_big_fil_rev_8_21_14_0_20_64_10]|nr:MAG: methylenetetrahydrofolate reductase [NAD(P)H] [Candidatus Omnitrophica bacterium CG11_big_fil_rev_8_21_14_0_20_64_10]